jgi:hypothetical protein
MDDRPLPGLSGDRSQPLVSRIVSDYQHRKERRRKGAREARRVKGADFVIFSPGNSGRTWLRSMLTSLLQIHYGLDSAPLIDFDNVHKLDSRVPQILVTHNRWLPYYRKQRPGRECASYYDSNLLVLVRNPLDTCVSQYFQWLHRSKDYNVLLKQWPARSTAMTLGEFLDHPVTGVGRLCDELNMWLRESEKIRHAKFVRYEDLLLDTQGKLKEIADFLHLPVSKGIVREAAELNSFENMQRREVSEHAAAAPDSPKQDEDNLTEALKARKGKIGGYSREINEERCLYYQELVRHRLSREFGYYDLPSIMPMNLPGHLK